MMTTAPGHSGNPDTCPACAGRRGDQHAPDPGVSVREYIDARNLVAETFRPRESLQYANVASTGDLAGEVVQALIALGWRKVAEPES